VSSVLNEAVRNHLAWFGRTRRRVDLEGATLFLGAGDGVLAFPRPDGDLEGAVELACSAGVRELGCWAAAPDAALGARLAGLGFQDGWQPHWMGTDPSDPVEPPVYIDETTACVPGLPYAGPGHDAALGGEVRHLVAREGDAIVGHVVLNVEGTSGGIYDMGVTQVARGRGHGSALTRGALGRAAALGCTTVTLNATPAGERVYLSVGFRSLGRGMTWWLFPGR